MADMTLEEALAAATVDSSTDSDILTISNDLRTITIPESIKNLGVESDEDVNRIHFKMPKMYKDVDLSEFDIRINYINGNDGDKYIVEDKTISEDYITFSWLVGRNALKTKGSTRFIVCLKKTDSESVVQKEFNTTLASINVLEGLETTEQIMQKYPDIIEQILKKIEGSTTITPDQIAEAVENYLIENPIETDKTMSEEGKAADAKEVGDRLSKLSDEIVDQADVDDDGLVSFKNSQGLTLFTLDLSEFSGANNVYGELILSADTLTIGEGESGTFTVKLQSAPTVNQVVYLALSDNTKLSISPSTLTFTPTDYSTEQTVTVTALEDEDGVDDAITVSLTSKKVSAKSLVVSIGDNDYVLTTDGLTFSLNLRNASGDNSSSNSVLTDTVGGITATTSSVAYDDTSGFIDDNGLTLSGSSTKLQMVYPIQNESIPNGFTLEWSCIGFADWQGAGNGYGNGYAFRLYMYGVNTVDKDSFGTGFAYKDTSGALVNNGKEIVAISDANKHPISESDLTQEHHYAAVFNTDGSASVYFDGIEVATRDPIENFANYVASGNVTFKIPYGPFGMYKYPLVISEVRIYEKALTEEEVINNYKVTVSNQTTVNF